MLSHFEMRCVDGREGEGEEEEGGVYSVPLPPFWKNVVKKGCGWGAMRKEGFVIGVPLEGIFALS